MPPSPELVTRRDPEPAGQRCPEGGVAVHVGLDDDGDSFLDDDEIDETEYLCDAPAAELVREDELQPGDDHCNGGGSAIHVGHDDDGDGVLDDEEIESTSYVCVDSDTWRGDFTREDWLHPARIAAIERARVVTGGLVIPFGREARLPLLEMVAGNLEITGGADVLDLPSLRTVGGRVELNTSGVGAPVLPALERIGGELFVTGNGADGESVSAPVLAEVGGRLVLWRGVHGVVSMPALRTVGGDLAIDGQITALAFDALESIEGDLLYSDVILDEIRLPGLRRLGGSLALAVNGRLRGIDLPALEEIGAELSLYGDLALRSVALPALRVIRGRLRLSSLWALERLDLGLLAAVERQIVLESLPLLTSLELPSLAEIGLNGGPMDDGSSLRVVNTGLEQLELPSLTSLDGRASIALNPALRAVRLVRLEEAGTLTLSSDDELEELSAPALVEIETLMVSGCPALSALDLRALARIETTLLLSGAPLEELGGLRSLAFVRLLSLRNLDRIRDLSGMAALEQMNTLIVEDNAALESLAGAERITQLSGRLELSGNPALASLAGLGQLTQVGLDVRLTSNAALTDIDLTDLLSIGGDLEISSHEALTTLAGLAALTSLGGEPSVLDNPQLPEAERQAFLDRFE
jgi:hypothetical protein